MNVFDKEREKRRSIERGREYQDIGIYQESIGGT